MAKSKKLKQNKKYLAQLPQETGLTQEKYLSEICPPHLAQEKESIDPEDFINLDVFLKDTTPFDGSVSVKKFPEMRGVVFQPPFPQYPEWDELKLKSNRVIFKIYISPEGLVEEIISMQASGDPEIDAALARYVRRWRFAPVLNQQGQWQNVKLNLNSNSLSE